MQPESVAYLWDVRNATERIADFTRGVNEEDYLTDQMRRSAVERQLEIVGEALKNLRQVDSVTAAHIPELRRIIGLRNVLAHGYAVVDDRLVWSAATIRAPELHAIVSQMLTQAD